MSPLRRKPAPRRYNRTATLYNNNDRPRRWAPGFTGALHGMFYLKWTPSELATLRAGALYTEVDEDGWVQRELGIGDDGLITHQLIPS